MSENEFESTQSVETESQASSEPVESANNEAASQQDAGQEQVAATEQTPFHEHPRWKEVMQQNNQYKTQLSQYEKHLQEMQARLQQLETGSKQAVKPENELFDRLKKIDPAFGSKFEEVAMTAQEIRELKEWKAQAEAERIRGQYESGLDKLCNEHNVTPSWKKLYDSELRNIAMSNPNLSLQDLPKVFKEVHDRFEALRREERGKYVADKSKDAKTPQTQSKGKVPASNKKEALPADRDEALQSIVSQALKMHRSNNDF